MRTSDVDYLINHLTDNIKAGADIHAGDGGYSIGTKEKYDEFVKARNQSMNAKLKELMIEAGYAFPEGAVRAHKLAELLIRECVGVADDYVKDCTCDEHINCKHPQSAIGRKIREHFGILQSYKVICDRTNNP